MSTVLAVDGGGYKTHLALVHDDGSLLSFARGPLSSPHQIGVDGCLELLERLIAEALERGGLEPDGRQFADVGQVLMAGVDFPREEEDLQAAVDGGGYKTHLALVHDDGSLLSFARGPLSSPHQIGVDGCLELLERLIAEALERGGLELDGRPFADVGQVLMAGVDFPREEEDLQAAVDARGWARRTTVANDTFAILRAGTDRGWGVALVCGAGMNCVGVGPDGGHVRHPALGAITGDWGGGFDVGLAGLSAAARSADGRGPKTALETEVPTHFGLGTPMEVAEAIHLDGLDRQRIGELAPLVLGSARADDVAGGIAERLASEAIAFVRVTLERLELTGEQVDVVLGGGLVQNDGGWLVERIARGLASVAPNASVKLADAPPVVGAALLGLDDLDAPPAAMERARRELTEAVASG